MTERAAMQTAAEGRAVIVQPDFAAARTLKLFVVGIPEPQGSKTVVGRGKRARAIEDNPHLPAWRTEVSNAAHELWQPREPLPPRVSVAASMVFVFPRPNYHFGARGIAPRWAGPVRVFTRPDLDKLVRAVCDALKTAGVVTDDSQIAEFVAPFGKWYADASLPWGARPGVHIRLEW